MTTETDPTTNPGRRGWASLVLAARVGLDVAWGIALPILSLGQLGSVALLAVLTTRTRVNRETSRWAGVAGLWGAVVGIGILRAPGDPTAWVWAGHYLGPLVVAAAVLAERPSRPDLIRPALIAVGGVLLLGIANGSAGWIVLHGWPRFVGVHGNLHTLAATLAVMVPVAATFTATARGSRDQVLGAVVLVAALVALAATFVRTAWVGAVVASATALVVQRRPRPALGLLVVGGGLAIASGRFGTVLSALRGEAPAGGWSKLGSSRVEIWSHTLREWASSGPVTWFLGDGLGAHLQSHRHFDPHSEVLSLLVQLGGLGLLAAVVLYGAVGAGLVRAAQRQPEPWTALALGLWVGAMATAPFSNDFVSRTTASWTSWALWAAALAATRPPAHPPPPGEWSPRAGRPEPG